MSPSIARSVLRRSAQIAGSFVCLVCLLAFTGAARAQGLYQALSSPQPTGTTPQGVAAGDFALSGFQSLAVTDSKSRNMRVYLATGPGTFGAAYTYPTCTGPTAVLARDLNGDGYPDLVVLCPSSSTVQAYQNDGTGHFGTSQTYTVTDPVAVVAGTFNGSIGLAFASGSGGVTVFTGINGNLVQNTIPVSGTLTGIVTGDFNHDGNLDLAVSDSANSSVHILFGDGTGNFTVSGSYSAGAGPSGLVTADYNHDGNLDLAVSDAGSNSVSILLGSATGTFAAPITQSAGTDPIAISEADVNSDGNPDVIAYDAQNASSATQGAVAVLLGNGDGTLQAAQISNLSDLPGTLAAVADFNRDGKPDLAITEQASNQVGLLINNTLPTPYPGGRSFAAPHQLINGYGNMADGIVAADFNKDGKLDIAVSYLEDNVVRVLLNNGTGASNFNAASVYAVGKQPYWIAAGDLNGDGYPDLVTSNTTDGTVSVLMNNGKAGNGTFAPAVTYPVGRLPYLVAIGDVNGDGYPDLAVANYGANTVSILLGSKTGTFTAGTTLNTCTNPYGVAIADFQHNGFPDVAVTCYATSQVEVFPNTQNDTFGTPNIYTTDAHPTSIVTGDFNRDGKLDIVTGNSTANDISFFAGNGNGTFNAGVISPSLNFPDSMAAGDINGDGILDIVGVAPNYNQVVVTLGKGDGTFGTFYQRLGFSAAKQPWAVALGDFNNDGQLDIATANNYYQVNLAIPAYIYRYMSEYPPTPNGQQSVDVLTNASAAAITLSSSPSSPLPANNSGVSLTASVNPAYSGGTPTGSVIFENAAGAPYGSGPYTLTNGSATVPSGGHLGSGQYLFTTLYSGDASFQPTTLSGASVLVTVSGTPVALTLSPNPVTYASTFTVSATVTGIAGQGAPLGTVTVYAVSGSTLTIGTINLTASGNNSTGSTTITAVNPLNVGNYQVYGYYNPSGSYPAGSSSNTLLTVTGEPTNTSLNCNIGLFGSTCTSTTTALTTNTRVPAGTTVNFTGPAGNIAATVGANGQATYSFGSIFGNFTVTATFPQQGNYAQSNTASFSGFCFFFCGARGRGPIALDSVSGISTAGTPVRGLNARDTKYVPFNANF